MSSLYDQLGESELSIVATLVGSTSECIGFRLHLRNIEALPEPFKMGDVVVAYGKHLEKRFSEFLESVE